HAQGRAGGGAGLTRRRVYARAIDRLSVRRIVPRWQQDGMSRHDFRCRGKARNRAKLPCLRTRQGEGGGTGSQAASRARRGASRSCLRGSRERIVRSKNEAGRRKTARLNRARTTMSNGGLTSVSRSRKLRSITRNANLLPTGTFPDFARSS